MTVGRLVGIGVGPGDPKLLTLRAVETIKSVDMIAYLAAENKESMARQIASEHLRGACEHAFSAPMRASRKTISSFYDETAEWLATRMADGTKIGFLCLGDPLFYGSFCYLLHRLRNRFICEVVPGITSIAAASAATLTPLAIQRDRITILPAGSDADQLATALDRGDCVVIMKLGNHLPKVRQILVERGQLHRCWLSAEIGWPNERIVPLADWPHDEAPYMAVLTIPAASPVP